MFEFFALAKIGKWVKDKLTLKNIAVLLGVLLIGLVAWKFYNWSFERGLAKQFEDDQKTIQQLTQDRDAWKTKYTAYRSSFKTWVERSELARLTLSQQNAATVKALEDKLKIAQKKRSATRGLVHEIPKYIPTAVDYDLPVGFVRLYNLSIEGEAGASSPEYDRISESVTLDVGAPSGVTLSTFAEYAVDNNAEAVYRGEVIRAWQEWYVKSKEQFDRAQQEAADSIPRVPDEPQSDANTTTTATEQPKPALESS